MNIDASFEKIIKIIPHKNSDNLEIAIVANYPCVVRKVDNFHEGDWVFYIREDAELVEYDMTKSLGDKYNPIHTWQVSLFNYLGANGRVKCVKIRGQISMGIILRPESVLKISENFDKDIEVLNAKIKNPEIGKHTLEETFGIKHWYNRNPKVGKLDIKCPNLEDGVPVTDEDNWEQIASDNYENLHIGKKCLVTKKLDGASTTVICRPDGSWSVASRNQTFKNVDLDKPELQNAYQRLTVDVVNGGLWWAKKFNKTIAFRGESCALCFNNNAYNKDKDLTNFYLFGCYFPEEENFYLRRGIYGTDNHFLKIAKQINDAGFKLNTVPVLETDVEITEDLLKKYNDMPVSFGEGVVINVKVDDINSVPETLTWTYKSKSKDYLTKI